MGIDEYPLHSCDSCLGKRELSLRTIYVHDFYCADKCKKARVCTVKFINGENMWVRVLGDLILPPPFTNTTKNLALKRRPKDG